MTVSHIKYLYVFVCFYFIMDKIYFIYVCNTNNNNNNNVKKQIFKEKNYNFVYKFNAKIIPNGPVYQFKIIVKRFSKYRIDKSFVTV